RSPHPITATEIRSLAPRTRSRDIAANDAAATNLRRLQSDVDITPPLLCSTSFGAIVIDCAGLVPHRLCSKKSFYYLSVRDRINRSAYETAPNYLPVPKFPAKT